MKKVSEWVSLGHPDKTADYISEYILDRYIERDKFTRYALEVLIKVNNVTLGGEITSDADFSEEDIAGFVREAVAEIGYTADYQKLWGVDNTISSDDLRVHSFISCQSNDIAIGVNGGGWGDQGIMFGMAINDASTNYMPKDIYLARLIGNYLFYSGIGGLDIKTQVYLDGDVLEKVIVAIPLLEDDKDGIEKVSNAVFGLLPGFNGELVINSTGRYVKHSSMGDCGITGRKLVVDFYGGNCQVGGGSPWTKDGTKADLSLNLLARKMALDNVIKDGTETVNSALSCCIGSSIIGVHVYRNGDKNDFTYEEVDISVDEVIDQFGLRKPVFAKMCREGLFYVF